ncbi:MAG: DUF692 family protein [Planctomycetota bacterium]|nr:DUF692 family protein [Planctomycetota bacterium]
MGVALGFALQPEERFLALTAELLDLIDYAEVAPETLWRSDASGGIVPNGFHERFAMLKRESGLAFVAHGVGFSVGSARPDAARRARWLERIAADHEVFEFEWYTDHLGVTELAGRNVTLPLAVPLVPAAARAVETSLRALQSAVPDTGFETSAFYFHLGDPLAEPTFVRAALAAPRTHLLLDLHNVWTNARNLGFDAGEYLERLPLERVIEIHLSGGTESDPAWLPSRAILRLDSHDHAVPEEVWQLAERFLPRCTNLRGLTLERMEGTVGPGDVAPLRAELLRARALLERANSTLASSSARSFESAVARPFDTDAASLAHSEPLPSTDAELRAFADSPLAHAFDSHAASLAFSNDPLAQSLDLDALARLELLLADAFCAPDLSAAFAALRSDREFAPVFAHASEDGFRIAALLIVRLRFERLLNGSARAADVWNSDPRSFTALFRRYHPSIPATGWSPRDEAALFERWLAERGPGSPEALPR